MSRRRTCLDQQPPCRCRVEHPIVPWIDRGPVGVAEHEQALPERLQRRRDAQEHRRRWRHGNRKGWYHSRTRHTRNSLHRFDEIRERWKPPGAVLVRIFFPFVVVVVSFHSISIWFGPTGDGSKHLTLCSCASDRKSSPFFFPTLLLEF